MNTSPAPAQPSAFDQAVALYQQGKFQEALGVAKRGLANFANVAGAAARQLGLATEAERYWRAAIAARPDFAEAHNNLGVLLQNRGLLDEAENAYRQALGLNPQHADAYNNLGNVLKARGSLDTAENAYRQALTLNPQHADAQLNLGILLLLTGRLTEGWRYYEARHATKSSRLAALPYCEWQGQSIAGKALLLFHEQGYGDQIQFCRYIGALKRLGAIRVDLVCDTVLATLFETLDDVDTLISTTGEVATLPIYDYWAFPLSISRHLGTTLDTIPADLPYLHPRPERVDRWAVRLPHGRLRVGLVWKGRQEHPNDANRSLPGLRTLAPLWSVPGVAFISLQKGAGEDEAAAPPDDQPLVHPGSAIGDFADTAAIVSQLDLVICVDTAIAHLAGALGKPCWVLLPHHTCVDWRWLLDRTDSPWYPGVMRLFRQTTPGDWATVVAQVAQYLHNHAMRK